MLTRIAAMLSEPVMGFFALLALSAGLGPMLLELPAAAESFCDAVGWGVVILFGMEYSVNLLIAKDRRSFLLDPWRILDLAILVAALASLLPVISNATRLGPALRVLRLFRVLLFGTRAGHVLGRPALPAPRRMPSGEPIVTILSAGATAPHRAHWNDLLLRASAPRGDWVHASNLSPERLHDIARAAGAPHVMIEAALHESSYPRLEAGSRWTTLALSIPVCGREVQRNPVLLLVTAEDVLSFALHPLDLQAPPTEFEGLPWGTRCALTVMRRALQANEELAGLLERETRVIEQLPPDASPGGFFEQSFRLKRQLATAKGDLWRLRGLLEMLADGRRTLPGLDPQSGEILHELVQEADYLHETVDDIRESVLSILDLHINMAAHETNRLMRVLAIVSAMALIPAVTGGLLGMNLAESPWGVTLGQVAFVTLILMLGVLYAFMAKGWLR